MIIERIGKVRQEIDRAKRLPMLQKAPAAERVLDDLAAIVGDLALEVDRHGQAVRALAMRVHTLEGNR